MMGGGNGRERGKCAGDCAQPERDGLVRALMDRLRKGKGGWEKDRRESAGPYPDGAIDVPGLDVPEREG